MSSEKATPDRLADIVATALRPVIREEIRDAVAELRELAEDEWITPAEAEQRYPYSARWWRDHADRFGERDGDGPKPRIRLSVARIERAGIRGRAA